MKRNREAGQAIASVALGLVVLTGIVGLAIDMGYLRYQKRRMQSAADSAAIAGASELAYASGNYVAAAKNDSKTNGFEDGVNGVTVTSSNPPVDAPFSSVANANNYVEVRVHQDVPTFFMRVFGVNTTSLSATAVAELGSSRGCVYSLDLVLGITLGGNNLSAPNCGVVDNAVLDLGGGCITASSIGVVLNLLGGCANPAPVIGIAPSPDPLQYLTAPVAPGCVQVAKVVVNSPAPTSLPPCLYSGGIQVAPTNTGAVTFQPNGIFFLSGIGLQTAGPSNLNANGVTFYVCDSASGIPGCTGVGASVQIGNTGNINLSAPVDAAAGGIPGVLFFQDRLDTGPACVAGSLIACAPTGANMFLTGALYFPVASLGLGANQPTAYTILVAHSIQFQGSVSIGTDYSSLTNGSPIKGAVLVQ